MTCEQEGSPLTRAAGLSFLFGTHHLVSFGIIHTNTAFHPSPHTTHSYSEPSISNSTHVATMLDAFEIITTSGVVLWSKSYVDIGSSVVNDFLQYAFIEERANPSASSSYKKDGKTVKWTTAKDLGLIFVVCELFALALVTF
jgi:Signal recognition particle, alpha subunit, N-terminal